MILAVLLALTALADPIEVRLCAMVDVEYADARAGDRWTDPSADRPGLGFRFEVRERGGGRVFPSADQEPFAEIEGPHAGCTPPLQLDTDKTYDAKVISEAKVRSNRIRSILTPAGNEVAEAAITGWSPKKNGSVRTARLPGEDPRWNHLAAVTYALVLQDVGIRDGKMMLLNAPGACCSANRRMVRIGDTDRKFVVTHELGHWVAANSKAGSGGQKSPDAPLDNCGTSRAPKSQLTKEYQSQAAVEAIADFYSALTWNTSEHLDDCEYQRHYPLDFDLDGRFDYSRDEPHPCHGDPWDGDPDPDDKDWLEDMVRNQPSRRRAFQRHCHGTLQNRSSQYDWLRYFWAMRTVEDVPVEGIYRIFELARPSTWNATDDGPAQDMPIVRWEQAAEQAGYGAEHRRQKDHGLDH